MLSIENFKKSPTQHNKRRNKKTRKNRRYKRKKWASHLFHVNCSANNTKIVVTDRKNTIIATSSGGMVGFKGSKRSTAYAAQLAAETCGRKVQSKGVKYIKILIKGLGKGRFSIAKTLRSLGFWICSIKENTPLPHNGCRPPKKRRL